MADLAKLENHLDVEARTCLVVIESSRGERNKYAYDAATQAFELKRLLPAGMSFPLDFGFIPSTKAEDGDPLDVMVVHDTPVPMGVVLPVRFLGIIEAEQTEDGKTVRNDRLVGIADAAIQFAAATSFADLGKGFVETLTRFWLQYEKLRGAGFKVIGVKGPSEAAARAKAASIEAAAAHAFELERIATQIR